MLNQIIAVQKGAKSRAAQAVTEIYHQLQKAQLFSGISRSYRPIADEGEQLPPEATRVQLQAETLLQSAATTLTELFDVTATLDWANCEAKADVIVGGTTLLTGVPVTHLLFLEKQLVDLTTLVRKLPTLDPSDRWSLDVSSDQYATDETQTTRTKKVPRSFIKAEATDKHPAQVELYHEDIVVGYWRTVKFSGALPAQRVNVLLERIDQLQRAVKFAREAANTAQAQPKQVGERIFDYLLAP